MIGLYAGLRREELATLPWSAFEVEEGYMTVTGKGSKQRTIPLHPAIVEALAAVPRTDDLYVFRGRRLGTPVATATIWSWVRLVAEEAGLQPWHPTCCATAACRRRTTPPATCEPCRPWPGMRRSRRRRATAGHRSAGSRQPSRRSITEGERGTRGGNTQPSTIVQGPIRQIGHDAIPGAYWVIAAIIFCCVAGGRGTVAASYRSADTAVPRRRGGPHAQGRPSAPPAGAAPTHAPGAWPGRGARRREPLRSCRSQPIGDGIPIRLRWYRHDGPMRVSHSE